MPLRPARLVDPRNVVVDMGDCVEYPNGDLLVMTREAAIAYLRQEDLEVRAAVQCSNGVFFPVARAHALMVLQRESVDLPDRMLIPIAQPFVLHLE